MDYKARRRYTASVETSNLKDIYPHDLQFYEHPPNGQISLSDFQHLALDRLKVLQLVESVITRSDLKSPEERKQALSAALRKDGLKLFDNLLHGQGCSSHTEADIDARKKDLISHFIMRLAYCDDLDGKKWFINLEVELFKMRFSSLNKEGIQWLLDANNYGCVRISEEEKNEIREGLNASSTKITNIEMTDFYKVPFLNVLDLVRGRKVYIKDGLAYISQSDLLSVFVSNFKKRLTDGLENARRCRAIIIDDERLMKFLKTLPGYFSGINRVVWSDTTTPIELLDELSRTSYPLCMRTLHEALRLNHHLRNSGRIQYGLFLKGIGVTLEDALKFWRMEFTKKIDLDKFEKTYVYSIRHTFGKEGKQTNYTPLGCQKIMSQTVGPGEYHGCPFKHMDRESLRQKLNCCGLPPNSVNEIVDIAKEHQYGLACTKYFEAVHNRMPERPIFHPNAYYAESRSILVKDSDSNGKLSQNSKFGESMNDFSSNRNDKIGTPSRLQSTPSRWSATPSRSSTTPYRNVTPSTLNATPSTSSMTPSTSIDQSTGTPARKRAKAEPINIEELLNDDTFAEMMDEV